MAYDSVAKWAAVQKADFNFSFYAMAPKIRPEPKGVVLIIGPFNGPVIMLISPLVCNAVDQLKNCAESVLRTVRSAPLREEMLPCSNLPSRHPLLPRCSLNSFLSTWTTISSKSSTELYLKRLA